MLHGLDDYVKLEIDLSQTRFTNITTELQNVNKTILLQTLSNAEALQAHRSIQ